MKAREHLRRIFRQRLVRRLEARMGDPPPDSQPSSGAFGAHVDVLVRPDPTSVFLTGWLWDPEARIEELRLLDDGGGSVPLQPSRFSRCDVRDLYRAGTTARPGIAAFAGLDRAMDDSRRFRLELRLHDQPTRHIEIPQAANDCPFATRAELVSMLSSLSETEATLIDLQLALDRSLAHCAAQRRVAADWTLGVPAARPDLSIVVPLYGGLDLLESQLTEFAIDPESTARIELVYVLDEPAATAHLKRLSQHLFRLYGVPCRYLALADNAGFGGATNTGVRHSRGDLVLLMNSDVIPVRPGWIGRLIDAWRQRPGAGALAPKLLFEDGSLQHAGLYWAPDHLRIHDDAEHPVDVEVWKNHQYYKGYPGDLPEANVARQVPAVSAACLLTNRALYEQLGGLDESYVFGDCEDSDLCLRLAARGLEIWYEPAVALYHLEGQSYPDSTRRKVTLYNNWLQDRRWRAEIVARMAGFPTPTCHDPA